MIIQKMTEFGMYVLFIIPLSGIIYILYLLIESAVSKTKDKKEKEKNPYLYEKRLFQNKIIYGLQFKVKHYYDIVGNGVYMKQVLCIERL